ncbi:HepT-like ribonuclease domain-containing protein [Dyadobacter aurulentus]|uniref:HepT-like ribonuclease domain-containing protein n=1 Tax=Dyadobacter sp. UC 10 TaxID=2605428 RepID=UPI001E50BF47|nr:HepT-like ribonuclease domain-containing protein [Dyadobacter sp. UC 10]
MGEATKKIPVDIKLQWSGIAWKNMAGMRDRLIHDYMGVNYFIVWDVAKNMISGIRQQVFEIIDAQQSEE